ncbi:uncharacterized protein BXZ73DRAFT_104535 [Epithele typhae]|uniref:uncharacterized protein n=1 Tax=Epithele typhae TaxID=378194 RepID=UPI0020071FFC|nr:uncharacterized protein BXZ73DRAFT_104535 [Epithele typhae]KAH9921245.1 hypothetical protein BXZ73DRAFT_104535 [Epithele typhae]
MEPPLDRLNDDVLLIILSYLEKRDLCALSLTCKHSHTISSQRLWTAVSITNSLFISCPWHENIYTNAHHVREMAVHVHDKAPQVSDILFATKNIRSLKIPYLYRLYDDPRLSMALAELRELRTLSCKWIEDKMLPTIQNIPSPDLTTLCLGYKGKTDLPSLLPVIASFPRLYTLILEFLKPTSAVDITSYPPFTSIQQLTLDKVTEPATDIIYLCPNVTSLDLGVDYPRQGDPHESRPKWRPSPIPRLSLTVLHIKTRDPIVSLLERRALRATHVRFAMLWLFTDDCISLESGEATSRLRRVLDVLMPHSLHLEISAMWGYKRSDPTGNLWQEVAATAPHLRALVLYVDSLDDGNTKDEQWPRTWAPSDTLVAELAWLPLVCVHLEVDPESSYRKPGEAGRQRLRALAAFPGKLAAAIPTLRVWWRVERGDGDASRSLVELWREDGERALELVQNEAFRMSDLDDIYSEKCRYVSG